jgi:hypothetical protein
MQSSVSPSSPFQSSLKAARASLVPGLLLQAAALGLVLGYYNTASVHAALGSLLAFRERTGLAFGAVSTALFGGALPFLYLYAHDRRPDGRSSYSWTQGAVLVIFWAYKGLEVDLFYRLQAYLFGEGHSAGTIALKVLFDQFCYSPFWSVPVTTLAYDAIQSGRGWEGLASVRADHRAKGWYRRRALPIMVANMGVWLPAVIIIYALPTPLQLPLQNIVLCFYTLIVAYQTGAKERKLSEEP